MSDHDWGGSNVGVRLNRAKKNWVSIASRLENPKIVKIDGIEVNVTSLEEHLKFEEDQNRKNLITLHLKK